MTAALTFLAGLVGLLVAGHFVVAGASRLGAGFGLSPMVIGLTIVAAGTSAPELAVVTQSIIADDTELAVGSIIGSNIANVLLVLGLAATFGAIRVTNRVVRIDIPIMIGASVLFLLMALDGRLARYEGALLLLALAGFVTWTLRAAPKVVVEETVNAAQSGAGPMAKARPGPWRAVVQLVLGVAALAVAARFVVSGAEEIALGFGIPELIVGLTIVALGTSAPEIVTTLIAALQGRRDLAVGNAVGSNIFNILLVLGSTSAFAPDGVAIGTDALELDLPVLVAAAVACLPMVFWDNRLDRWEGAVFVAYYAAYLVFLILDAAGHRAANPFALIVLGFVLPLTALTVAVVVVGQVRARRRRQEETLDEPMPDLSTQSRSQSRSAGRPR